MEVVHTYPDVRYWSAVQCCTIVTHMNDLEVKVTVFLCKVFVLVKVFRDLERFRQATVLQQFLFKYVSYMSVRATVSFYQVVLKFSQVVCKQTRVSTSCLIRDQFCSNRENFL